MSDQSSLALLIALGAILASTGVGVSPLALLCDVLGLPPPVVILRRCRPTGQAALVIALVAYRAVSIISLIKNSTISDVGEKYGGDSLSTSPDPLELLSSRGLLDALVRILWHVRSNISAAVVVNEVMPENISSAFVAVLGTVASDVLGVVFLRAAASAFYSFAHTPFSEVKAHLVQSLYEFAEDNVAFVQKELAKEEEKMMQSIESSLKDPNRTITRTLPDKGRDAEQLLDTLREQARGENDKWQRGMVSGTVYSGEADHTELLNAVYAAYSHANPLHTDIWPSICQMEAEVVSMTASLLNGGDENVVGATSSGGTESIVLAVRSAKEYFGRRRGITRPEVVACETAHAGLDKACDMFGIRLIKLPADSVTFELRPEDVERAITRNTILVYSSAPCFPQGVIDPIARLSDLAVKYDIGLHVDACLGGFVLPFAKALGYDVPQFDFACPGVTSASVDTHKYGYAAKGTSVVLYRNRALRRAQYFAFAEWTGGLYSTPTIAGSRPGALLACAWASMTSLGAEGYELRVNRIMETTIDIAKKVGLIEGLHLVGGMPRAMVVCFGSDELDVYRVGDAMAKCGWSLNALQRPACIHLCVTLQTVARADEFVNTLSDVVQEIRMEGDDGKKDGNAAIYGLAGSLPPGPVTSLLKCYTDATLKP